MGMIMALIVLEAWLRGVGLYSLKLTILPLLAALSTSMLGLRHGLTLTALGLLALLGLSWAESLGWAVSATAMQSLTLRTSTHVLALAAGLSIGVGALRVLERLLCEAREHNTRFRGLHTMAADWYWEMARDYRFTHLAENTPGSSGFGMQARLGKTPWEIEHLGLTEEDLDAHRADLEITFVDKRGRPISMVLSAAPFTMEGQQYLVTNARDVSESERTRLIHQAVLENASIGITLTRDQHFVQVNRLVEEMSGWPTGSLTGQPDSVIWRSQEDYLAVGLELGGKLAKGLQVETQRLMRRRDGSLFWCRLLARAVDPLHPAAGGTIWILEDITERRQVEAALASAKNEAQAANRAKSTFLANTSHEIRTPLNGLLGLARMLQQPDLPAQTQRQYADQLLASAESLSSLISDILDLAKIEAGRLTLEAAPFALRDMLATLRLTCLASADSRGLSFLIKLDPALPIWVLGDAIRTRQILSNFLSNAIKFTASGLVVLSAHCLAGDRVRFAITDIGPGIAPCEIARLFDPFTQADESTTRRFGGTGLGLSICRELAELMNGSVGVHSQPGQGSVFWAELPLPAASAPLSNPPLRLQNAPDDATLKGLHVLMVEDHPVNMLIAVAQLQQWGLEVSQATDGS